MVVIGAETLSLRDERIDGQLVFAFEERPSVVAIGLTRILFSPNGFPLSALATCTFRNGPNEQFPVSAVVVYVVNRLL